MTQDDTREAYVTEMQEKVFLALTAAGTTESTAELYKRAEEVAREYADLKFPKVDNGDK